MPADRHGPGHSITSLPSHSGPKPYLHPVSERGDTTVTKLKTDFALFSAAFAAAAFVLGANLTVADIMAALTVLV